MLELHLHELLEASIELQEHALHAFLIQKQLSPPVRVELEEGRHVELFCHFIANKVPRYLIQLLVYLLNLLLFVLLHLPREVFVNVLVVGVKELVLFGSRGGDA